MSAGTVLVGVDDRPPGREALDWAIDEARRRGAVLHLVRVVCDIDWLFSAGRDDIGQIEADIDADRDMLAAAVAHAQDAAPETPVVSELVTGDLFAELNARTAEASVLVLGADEDPTAGDLVGEWFTAHAHCPVTVVGSGVEPRR